LFIFTLIYYLIIILDNIDNYVIDSKNNIIKADELIREEVSTKGFWTKSMICLVLIITVVLVSLIIGIIFLAK